MATKKFCDHCGKEGSVNKFQYKCHLTDMAQGRIMNGYVDSDLNSISGRTDVIDLCNKCYNELIFPVIKKYFDNKKEK
jgi:hypothetical protein